MKIGKTIVAILVIIWLVICFTHIDAAFADSHSIWALMCLSTAIIVAGAIVIALIIIIIVCWDVKPKDFKAAMKNYFRKW